MEAILRVARLREVSGVIGTQPVVEATFFLKMAVIEMTSPQIRKVGVVLTTMHARSLLAEATRFAERLGVPLALIHATTGEAESQAHLREAANQLTIPVEKH